MVELFGKQNPFRFGKCLEPVKQMLHWSDLFRSAGSKNLHQAIIAVHRSGA